MSPPIRILVVDDSAVFRMVLARVLGRTDGMEVIGVAADGLEALEAAHRLDPDVITLDVEMPGLDGLETLRRLLAERPTRVVMLSRATKAGAEVTLDALKAGAIDAIAKPDEAMGQRPESVRRRPPREDPGGRPRPADAGSRDTDGLRRAPWRPARSVTRRPFGGTGPAEALADWSSWRPRPAVLARWRPC